MKEIVSVISPLTHRLATLDAFLTGKDWKTVLATARGQDSLEEISSRTYYLSDGGYSRVCISLPDAEDMVYVFLDSVSTDRARERWTMCRELISDVCDAATEEWRRLGYLA